MINITFMFNLDYGRFRGMDFKKIIIMYGVSGKDKDKYKGREQLPSYYILR